MSKVQEYLSRKAREKLNLPTMYVVHSSREGVDKPLEKPVTAIKVDAGWSFFRKKDGSNLEEKVSLTKYSMEGGFPYEILIPVGQKSSKEEGHGSGFGDLWSWTYFCTLSKDEALEYYKVESKRVQDKYFKEFRGDDDRTWKETFENQTDNGKFWKNLHKENFDKERFLMRSDVHHIVHKAQSDILKQVAKEIKDKSLMSVDEIINHLKQTENDLWDNMYKS